MFGASDRARAYDSPALVIEHSSLARCNPVCGLVEVEVEPAFRGCDPHRDRRRAVAQLRLGALDRDVQGAVDLELRGCERGARADDDGVRPGVAAQRVQRLAGRQPEAAALARREAPEASVTAEL